MKKIWSALAAAAILAVSLPVSAGSGPFTVDELHAAAKIATDTFKNEYTEHMHKSIYAIKSAVGKDGGSIKIYYKHNNEAQSIEYFCHYHHKSEIDCHEH